MDLSPGGRSADDGRAHGQLTDERAAAGEILRRYARTRGSGRRLVRCGPTNYEKAMRDRYGNWSHLPKEKIIFDSRERAQEAADALTALLGWNRQRPYACTRSRHGHYHLTRDGTEGGNHGATCSGVQQQGRGR